VSVFPLNKVDYDSDFKDDSVLLKLHTHYFFSQTKKALWNLQATLNVHFYCDIFIFKNRKRNQMLSSKAKKKNREKLYIFIDGRYY
jgi:hypothetical protein